MSQVGKYLDNVVPKQARFRDEQMQVLVQGRLTTDELNILATKVTTLDEY